MLSRVPVSIALLSFTSTTFAQTITPSKSAQGASLALNPSFAGFGIEPSNLFSFTGGTSTNELSVNLLQNLADYAGRPPHIRLGGNTGDYMIYSADYSDYALELNQDAEYNSANMYTIGPNYFTAIDRFPDSTPITFGLNLAYQEDDFVDNIVKEATAVIENLKSAELYSFEIGNEPDLYHENGFRNTTYGGANYVAEFLERATAIYEQVLKPRGMSAKFFEPPATASTIGTTFEIAQLIADGITQGINGSDSFVSAWNQHDYFYFIDVSTYALTVAGLLNLKASETQFSYWATQISIALDTGLPYHLREMASVGPIGIEGISDTFGAALWTLNWACYMATLNVSSVQFHMTDNSYAAPWAPLTHTGITRGVRPSYYAFAAMAQLLGSGNGTTQLAPVTATGLSSDYTDYVRSYAAYFNGNLNAVVIINAKPSNASATKSGVTFTIENLTANERLYVSYLSAPGSDSTSGAEWNGMSYEQDSVGTADTVNSTATRVDIDGDGKASVYVQDSTAVIVNVGYLLGSRAVSIANSSGTSSKKSSAMATGQVATTISTSTSNSPAGTTPTASSASATHTSISEAAPDRMSHKGRDSVFAMGAGLLAAQILL